MMQRIDEIAHLDAVDPMLHVCLLLHELVGYGPATYLTFACHWTAEPLGGGLRRSSPH